jgi:hypothetical protein
VRWRNHRSGSSSDSALQMDQRSSEQSHQSPWSALSGESGRSHDAQRASASKRRCRNWSRICGAGAATSVSAKLLASSRTLLAGSVRDFVWHSGDNGKHPVVVGQLSWNGASAQNWRATRLAAAAVPGTSPTPRPYPSRFPRPILNRSVSRIWRMRVSVTISNRRVRTRTHGGVAGVSGQPLPLCRSNAAIPQPTCLVQLLTASGQEGNRRGDSRNSSREKKGRRRHAKKPPQEDHAAGPRTSKDAR